jgi:hypothetical protein
MGSAPSPLPPHSPSSPIDSNNDEEYDASPGPPVHALLPIFGDAQCFTNYNEEPESYIENDNDLLDVEADPDYPQHAASLILQQDSDLSDDEEEYDYILSTFDGELNALSSEWTPPTPNNYRPIVQGIEVHPVEESLLSLLIENHLPKRMYSAIMEWGHYASSLDYDFAAALTYQTVLIRMIKKYVHVSGGPPRSEIV